MPSRRVLGERADGALAAQAPARADRVLGVQLGAVVLAERRRDAALREIARRRRSRPFVSDSTSASSATQSAA